MEGVLNIEYSLPPGIYNTIRYAREKRGRAYMVDPLHMALEAAVVELLNNNQATLFRILMRQLQKIDGEEVKISSYYSRGLTSAPLQCHFRQILDPQILKAHSYESTGSHDSSPRG